MHQDLINEFETTVNPKLSHLLESLTGRLRHLINERGIFIQSLTARVKSTASLQSKLARPDRNYEDLFDITDLIAFRVITYSEDIIADVARLIEQSFDIDYSNSVNKLNSDDVQKFGYRSLHYVARVPPEFLENTFPANFRFEIQIRTILQHTWAEIEHDIGYKSSEQLPRELRRRFSQVASLLEIADREFAAIRTELKSYQTAIEAAQYSQSEIGIDHISLQSILVHREEIKNWDNEVAQFLGLPVDQALFFPDYLVKALRTCGLLNIDQVSIRAKELQHRLKAFLPIYFEFADHHWNFKKSAIPTTQTGYGLLFLAHLHILEAKDLLINRAEHLTRFYLEIDELKDSREAKSAARALLTCLTKEKFLQELSSNMD